MSLALWDGSHAEPGARRHPHPHPSRRFRLDLHRHLWDARMTDEVRSRSGADRPAADDSPWVGPEVLGALPPCPLYAVDRWAAEAAILLRADGQGAGGLVSVRLGGRRRLLLDVGGGGPGSAEDPAAPATVGIRIPAVRLAAAATDPGGPAPSVLPDVATW
ncbi:hypothetical protein JHN49_43165, partial [Streptomyces sp. MBT57]|nr:hypothetical protein [Streptomyces sp. MBT57]